jgi:hypothetical protein
VIKDRIKQLHRLEQRLLPIKTTFIWLKGKPVAFRTSWRMNRHMLSISLLVLTSFKKGGMKYNAKITNKTVIGIPTSYFLS